MAKIISTKGKQFRIAMDDGTFLDQFKKKHKTIFKVGDQVDVIQDGTAIHVMLKVPDRNRFTRFQKKLMNFLLGAIAILMIPVLIIAFSPDTEVDPKIGETLTVSDVDYKVLEVLTADKVGSTLSVKPNGKFVIIHLEISNRSASGKVFDSSDFRLMLDETTFSPSLNGPVVYSQKEFRNVNNASINPGLGFKGVIMFDVPVDLAESKEFKLKISDSSLGLSSGTIDLSNR